MKRTPGLLFGVLLLTTACGGALAQQNASGPVLGPQKASEPVAEKQTPQPEIAALIVAGQETTLSSQMAGKIRKLSTGLGEAVRKGAHLIEFDCSEQQAQVEAARAEYRGARETHLARLRLQALGAAGELEVAVAAAAADKARGQLDVRRAQLAYCTVQAPFSGKVARLRVKAAESVSVGQPLMDLVNTASLKAQMFVPASWTAWLEPGARLTIQIRETGQSFAARVSKLNSRVDGVSQQLELEAEIEKRDGDLLPGMVGYAVFAPHR